MFLILDWDTVKTRVWSHEPNLSNQKFGWRTERFKLYRIPNFRLHWSTFLSVHWSWKIDFSIALKRDTFGNTQSLRANLANGLFRWSQWLSDWGWVLFIFAAKRRCGWTFTQSSPTETSFWFPTGRITLLRTFFKYLIVRYSRHFLLSARLGETGLPHFSLKRNHHKSQTSV